MIGYLKKVKYYTRYQDEFERVWFVPAEFKFAGDDIWMWNSLNQRGSEGRVVQFDLGPGSSVHVKGPWKSTPEALLAATGVDLIERRAVKLKASRVVGGMLLYQDHQFVEGSVAACRDNAQLIANQNNVRVKADITTPEGEVTFLLNPQYDDNGSFMPSA